MADPSNTANTFAKKLDERMKSQFSYLLNLKAKDFQAIFWVATYLSPVYRVLLASDTEKMTEVKKFLQSKSVISLLFVIVMFFLLDLIPDHQDTQEDVPTEWLVPGLPLISKTIFSGDNVSGANPLGKDIALYERKAVEFVDKMKAEALSTGDTKLAMKDPLKFWISQVRHAM